MLELEEVVFEVVEVPEDGLAVEVAARIGQREVDVGSRLLDGGEVGEGLLVEVEHLGVESPTLPLFVVEESVERLVAEVLLEVVAAVVGDGIEFGDRHAFGVEVASIGEEGFVLAEVVGDAADGRDG